MKITNEMIHPELRKKGKMLKMFTLPLNVGMLKIMNKLSKIGSNKCKANLNYEEKFIDRADGSKIRVCVYSPKERKENVCGLLWIHGGGYATGTAEQDEVLIDKFIKLSGCVVVSVDYRLSVDAPYPAALEDCYSALLWLKDNADKLGVNVNQIAIGGTSAGGGLCAALSMYAKDKKEVNIAFQIPLYPMIDDRETSSNRDNDAPAWSSKQNYLAWKLYLGELYGKDVPKYAVPSRCTDYNGLPPTITFVGDIEPFYDETITFVENLSNANVPTHFRVYKGCYHAFEYLCSEASISKEATNFLLESFEFAISNYYANQKQM